ncbi:MAG: hypothetical protein H6707_02460 [Deltaproteobacteria bacterium]|nr:hypothetical protein [Deltaproteobacteria bacterium]
MRCAVVALGQKKFCGGLRARLILIAGLLILIAGLSLLATGCSGSELLKKGTSAPALSTVGAPKDIDGRELKLEQLARRGPVVLVFLRGFF